MSGWKCPECGLEYDSILPADAVAALRSYPRRYKEQFPPRDDDEKPDGVIRRRPEPTVWSALEYAAHVADAVRELGDAVRVMTIQDHPTIGFFDPDERAEQERYNERDRERVLSDLTAACEQAATNLADVDNKSWSRTATFPWGDRDALTMARNAVHEGYHHLRDIELVLRRVVGRPST
jgi:hypothetical protein